MQRVALRDFDSGSFIIHIPVPPMAGPFLIDTLENSHYQIIFHQPNVKMDSTEVGVFFWGLAMPWMCSEIKLPVPKFLAGRAAAAAEKAANSKLAGAIDKAAKAKEALDDVLNAPAADTDARPEEVMQKAEAARKADTAANKAEAFDDSKNFVDEQQKHDQRITDQRKAEKEANQAKVGADQESRAAAKEAEQHDAAARAHRDKAQGATDGTTEGSMQAERSHRAAASSEQSMAESEDRRAQVHSDRASSHRQQQALAEERSRQANADADHHEAAAQEENERAVGVRSGGSPESMDKADQHAALAQQQRERASAEAADATQHQAQADANERESTSARKAADSSRRQAAEHEAKADAQANRVEADRRQAEAQRARAKSADAAERAKQLQKKAAAHREERGVQKRLKKGDQVELSEKQSKVNPYKQVTGIGNANMLLPSLLAHVPLPATVQIYMSWAELGRNWLKAIIKVVFSILDGYVGIVFDSVLAPGKEKVGKFLVDNAKALVSGTILGGLQKLAIDHKIEIKISLKQGPVSVSATFDKDEKTGKWTWSAKGDASKELGETGAKGSVSGSASGDFSSDETSGANDGYVDTWGVGAKAESHKTEATIEHTTKSTGETETAAEVGHHTLPSPTPATNAQPPVDYAHSTSLFP
jgi:hypothetical protein